MELRSLNNKLQVSTKTISMVKSCMITRKYVCMGFATTEMFRGKGPEGTKTYRFSGVTLICQEPGFTFE